MTKRKISLTPDQARGIFDGLQLGRTFIEQRIEAHQASGDRKLETLQWERLARINAALDYLGAELQDIAEPTYQERTT